MTPFSQAREAKEGWRELRKNGIFAIFSVVLLWYIHNFFIDPLLTNHKATLDKININLTDLTSAQKQTEENQATMIQNQGAITNALKQVCDTQARVLDMIEKTEQRLADIK